MSAINRFKKADIPKLVRPLQIHDVIGWYQGTICDAINSENFSLKAKQVVKNIPGR